MNASQNRILTSGMATVAVLKSHPAALAIPGFAPKLDQASALLTQITEVRDNQTQSTKGQTARREALLEALHGSIMELANDVTRYADEKARPDLAISVNLTPSAWKYARQNDRPVLAHRVIEAAASIVAEADALPYGITPERLAAVQAKLDLAVEAIAEPRKTIKEKRAATRRLVELFADLERVFSKHLDRLVFTLRHDVEFYAAYEGARRVARSPRRKDLPLPTPTTATVEKIAA